MKRLGSPLTDRRSAYLLVGVIAALVYANALPNRFAYDDVLIVQTNPAIQSLESLPGALVAPYWPGEHATELGLWRPVTTLLFGLQWIASDGAPVLFHAVNVALHVVASLLVLAVLFELMPMGGALSGALLFAVHPVHVEAVANIIGLSEIVSTSAVLAACLVHLRSGPVTRWPSAVVVAVLYLIGFGAKESAVTLPGLIFLVDAARERIGFGELAGYLRRRWPVYATMLVVAGGLLTARVAVLGSIADPLAPMGGDVLREIPRIWTLGEIWMHYVRLWVFPIDLSADYSPGVIPVSFGWHSANLVGVGLALLVLGFAVAAFRRPAMGPTVQTGRAAGFGVAWFVIAVSPVSNTLFLAGVLLAERTLYLPSVGLAAATGWLVARMARERPRGAWVALVLALGLASARTWTRNPTWYDNPTALARLIGDYPQSGRSQWILGDALMLQGRVSEGLQSYRAAIDLLGTHYQLLAEISMRLMQRGDYGAAETLSRFAAREAPEFPRAWSQLALIRAEHADPTGTERYARRTLELAEIDPTRRHLLAWALAAQGRLDEARVARAEAEQQGRAVFWQQYLYVAYVRQAEGDTAAALAAVDSAWARAYSEVGKAALDSVRVTDFGLDPLLQSPNRGPNGPFSP